MAGTQQRAHRLAVPAGRRRARRAAQASGGHRPRRWGTRARRRHHRRARQFVDNEVPLAVNGYWERAELPFELMEKLRSPTSWVTGSMATAARP